VALFVHAASLPLTDPDEARFARTSVEMLRAHDPVVPRFEGQPRLVKPPLLHWLQMALFSVTRPGSSLAARLPAILATLASVALLAAVARRRFGEEGAFWCATVLATSPLIVLLGRLGTLDALLGTHVLAVVVVDLARPEVGVRTRAATTGALLGLAFLVKGPVGVIVPLLVILAGRSATRSELLPGLGTFATAVGAWCVVVLPWGLAFLRRLGPSTAVELLRTETVERYFAGTSHVEPFWYYLPVLAVAVVPWTGPLVVGIVRAIRMREDPAARTGLYASAGLLAGVLFFSAGQGKLPTYIAPLIPLAALVVAWEIGRELLAPGRRIAAQALTVGTLGLLAIGLALAALSGLDGPARRAALLGAMIHGAAMAWAVAGVVLRRARWVYGAAAAGAGSFLLVAMVLLPPSIVPERTAAGLVRELPQLRSGRPVVLMEMRVPSLTLYLDQVPERATFPELESRLGRPDRPIVVIDERELGRIPAPVRDRLRELGSAGKYHAFEERTAIPDPEDP
jgi:4-amino-4-deoxy-L-arabinose transferase